jgi:DNA-nicking Smr family endonuclease
MTDPQSIQQPIDGTLDLHTFLPGEVADLVPEYLAACREHDIFQVRIIHGKGIGTLRRTVESVLGRLACVESFRTAPEDAGGWGATIVTLLRK